MSKYRTIEGDMRVANARFAILAARFNGFIVERLVDGAVDTLRRHGAEPADLHVLRVPGAWELPVAARRVADSGRYDGVVALGCVIRGATPHFDYVCSEASRGLGQVAEDSRLPVGFGVLTVDTAEQATERASGKVGNKGAEAALAVIEMVNLLRRIEG